LYVHSTKDIKIHEYYLTIDDEKYFYGTTFQPSISLSKKILEYSHEIGFSYCFETVFATKSDVIFIDNLTGIVEVINEKNPNIHFHAEETCISIKKILY
jgi:hypothetical protein